MIRIKLTNSYKHILVNDKDCKRVIVFGWYVNVTNGREVNVRTTLGQSQINLAKKYNGEFAVLNIL